VNEKLEGLLDELARRHAAGAPLDLPELLDRAGPDSERFGRLADRFLAAAPRRDPSAEALERVRLLDDPPLLRARLARRLKVDDVVVAILRACGLREETKDKVRVCYQMLEGGTLDPAGVREPVWSALAEVLGRPARALAAGFAPPALPPPAAATFLRADAPAADMPAPLPPPVVASDPPDEVDRLFGLVG
jgi:hypothetical protein